MSETNVKTGNRQSTKVKQAPVEDIEDLNLDKIVNVRNLADWDVGFARRHDGQGDVQITKNSTQRLSRNEIIAQINNGIKLFTGIDGHGGHATLYIEDAATRKYVGFETDDKEQEFFDIEKVKALFTLPQAEYEAGLRSYIVTRAEKHALMAAIKELGVNDYRKIVFATSYTGINI